MKHLIILALVMVSTFTFKGGEVEKVDSDTHRGGNGVQEIRLR